MEERERDTSRKRRYPPFYERAIPIALAILAVVVLVLLLIIAAVVLGMFPGGG